jgi:hypothetical protein
MSTTTHSTTPSGRPRTLQDDLLDDLRQAAPLPVARTSTDRPVTTPAGRPEATDPEALTVELRLTPRTWFTPSVRRPTGGAGLVVKAGPLRLHVRSLGR